jgi:hypothetical protein
VVFMWFRLLRREAEFARDAELGLVPDHDEEEVTVAEAAAADAPQDADSVPVR